MATGSVSNDNEWETVSTGAGRSSDWETVGQDQTDQSQPDTSSFWHGLISSTVPSMDTLKLLGRAAMGDTSAHMTIGKAIVGASKDQIEKAIADWQAGEHVSAIGHAAGSIPLIGTAAAQVGETIGSGKINEGLGQAVGAVLPFAPGAGLSDLSRVTGLTGQLEKIPKALYGSALGKGLKSVTETQEGVPKIAGMTPEVARSKAVEQGLQLGALPTRGGVKVTNTYFKDLKSAINEKIAAIESGQLGPANVVSRDAVASRVDELMPRYNTVTREADQSAIQGVKDQFIADRPTVIQPTEAQQIKTATSRELKNKYGQMKTPPVEAEKALERGLKEELEALDPDLKYLNQDAQASIVLGKALMRASKSSPTFRQSLVTAPVTFGVGYLAGGYKAGIELTVLKSILDRPDIKSALAIAVNRAQQLKAANLAKGAMTADINQPDQWQGQ